jgi:hypothetical protein
MSESSGLFTRLNIWLRERSDDQAWLGSFMCAGLITLIVGMAMATVGAMLIGQIGIIIGISLAVLGAVSMLVGAVQTGRLAAAQQERISEARKRESERQRKISILNNLPPIGEPIGVVESSRTHDVAI